MLLAKPTNTLDNVDARGPFFFNIMSSLSNSSALILLGSDVARPQRVDVEARAAWTGCAALSLWRGKFRLRVGLARR